MIDLVSSLEREGWSVRRYAQAEYWCIRLSHPLSGVMTFKASQQELLEEQVARWPERLRVSGATGVLREQNIGLVGGLRKTAASWLLQGMNAHQLLNDVAVMLLGQGIIDAGEYAWLVGAGPARLVE